MMTPEELIAQIKELDSNHLLEWDDLNGYAETDDYYQIAVSTKSDYELTDDGEFIDPQMQELSDKLWDLDCDKESLLEWKHILYNFWINK